jgi:hypothetical protein
MRGLRRQHETFVAHCGVSTALTMTAGGPSRAGTNEYTMGCVQDCVTAARRGRSEADMHSALGCVSGSKAALHTVHAKLEA